MKGQILEEFDIEAPDLVFKVASRDIILKFKGKSDWDKVYKDVCNTIRERYGLRRKAVCVSTFSSKTDGMLDFKHLHVTVLDYDIKDDEHFFIKGDRDDGTFEVRDDDPEEDLTGDGEMGKILEPIRQTKVIDPYIVQLLLSEPFIIARKGPYAWSEKYVKASLNMQNKLGEEQDVEWHNGMVVLGVKTDEDGIVDYREVVVSQFDHDLRSHMSYSVNQDGSGKVQLVLLDEEE